MTTIPVSVLIPAKNEELNLGQCLESLKRADEIIVVDSQSTDRTVEIAESHGAKVEQFKFNGRWPKKKNWSLENLEFRNEWVLIVDCDERIPEELWDEIAEKIQSPEFAGYYLNRKVYFLNRWIRYGGRYPDWNLRLLKHREGRYEKIVDDPIPNIGDNEVHEHVIFLNPESKAGYLKCDMDHKDRRDLHAWLARHNRYSSWEAYVYRKLLTNGNEDGELKAELFGTPTQRTRWLKRIWVRLPLKPVLRFILVYFIQLGFLDGMPGFIYACLLSHYEFNIGVKLYELQHCGGHVNSHEAISAVLSQGTDNNADNAGDFGKTSSVLDPTLAREQDLIR